MEEKETVFGLLQVDKKTKKVQIQNNYAVLKPVIIQWTENRDNSFERVITD
jgi:hypothetical protein